MRGRLHWIFLALATPACHPKPIRPAMPATTLAADVAYLASAPLEGRAVGSAGGAGAVAMIVGRYKSLGVNGASSSDCTAPPCEAILLQVFHVHGVRAENVVVSVPGAEPSFRGRYVIIGAHYDHLGDRGGLWPGADDNASGTAAVLELGRRLVATPPPTSVVLAHFDAEEVGLLGSRTFVAHSPVPLDSIALMINLDMVGRLQNGPLVVELTSHATRFRTTVDSLAAGAGISLRYSRITAGRSDHSSFAAQGVPAIAVFTGYHSDYHRHSDTTDKIDFKGLLRIVDLVEALVRTTGTQPINGR